MDDGIESAPADDFKRIPGIGPVIERHLHEANIRTYAALGALTPQDIAGLVDHLPLLTVERITRQDWPGLARMLAAESAPEAAPAEPANNRRFASFSVEIRLDDFGHVQRTRVVQLHDGDEQIWSGWDEARLMQFIGAYTNDALHPAGKPLERLAPGTAPSQRTHAEAAEGGELPSRWRTNAHPDAGAATPASDEPSVAISDVLVDALPAAPGDGTDHDADLRATVVFRIGGRPASQQAAEHSPYTVTVLACRETDGRTLVVGAESGALVRGEREYVVTLPLEPPPNGRYQLVGVAVLMQAQIVASALGPVLTVVS